MRRRRVGVVGAGLGLTAMALLGACGDDESASDEVCDARDDLDENVTELRDLDLGATSINDVQDILGDINDDLTDMRDADEDRLSPQIDDLESSVDDLGSAVADLGSSSSLDAAADTLRDALGNVGDAAEELRTAAASDCD